MISSKMINLLKNDIQVTFTSQWKKFIPIVIIGLLGCFQLLLNDRSMAVTPGFINYLTYFFEGIEPFIVVDANTIFKIPAIWLFLHLYIFYLIVDYPIQDMKMIGKETFVRVGNRRIWWVSKCLTTIMIVLISYIVLLLTVLLFTLFSGGEILKSVSRSSSDLILAVLILPFVTSCCVGFFQLSISLLYRSMLSFLGVVVVLVMSVYFIHPLLFGNYLMLLRNQLLLQGGVVTSEGFILAAVIGIAGYSIGHITIKKLNIY